MTEEQKALVPLQERRITFYEDEILVVLVEVDGQRQVYVPMRELCESLGLTWSSQYMRLKRDEELADALISVLIMRTEAQQHYEVTCLQLEYLAGWLFTLTPSKVREDLRDKVKRYRRECFRALWGAFQRGELFAEEGDLLPPPPTPIIVEANPPGAEVILADIQSTLHAHDQASRDGQARIEAQLSHAVELITDFFSNQVTRIEKIDERTQRLTPAHAHQVAEAVDRLVRLWRRRASHLTEEQAKSWAYHSIHQQFQVSSYKEISDDYFDEVIAYVQKAIRRASSGQEPEQGKLF